MLSDKSSGISSCGSRLSSEARSVCGIVYRKSLLRDYFLAQHIGNRHLCCRDKEEVLLRYVEHILLKLRKLSGSCHCSTVYHEGRKYLHVVLVYSMKVQHEVGDGSFESGSEAFINSESGSCDLARSLPVQDVQVCTDIPVSLGFKIKGCGFFELSYFYVIRIICSGLNEISGDIGDTEKAVSQIGFNLCDLLIQFLDLSGEFLHLCHDGRSVLSCLLHLGDLLGYGVLPVLHGFHFAQDLSSFVIQRECVLYSEASLKSSFYACFGSFIILSDSFYV